MAVYFLCLTLALHERQLFYFSDMEVKATLQKTTFPYTYIFFQLL
jgi:hypothetical protein